MKGIKLILCLLVVSLFAFAQQKPQQKPEPFVRKLGVSAAQEIFLSLILDLFVDLITSAFAQPEIEECINFFKAGDYQRAINAGQRAVKAYPNNATAYLCLGVSYLQIGELQLALSNFLQAEKLTQDKEYLMYIYNLIGHAADVMGRYDGALFYYNKALSLAKELGKTNWEAGALNNIAVIYYRKGDYDKALAYYEESLRLKENEEEKAPTYNNIATVYDAKGEYQKALEYFQKAIDIDERYGNYHRVAQIMLNMGNTYRKTKDYEQAEKYLMEGLNRIKRVRDKYWEATAYGFLGLLYKDLNNKQKAVERLTMAYNLYKSIGAEKNAQAMRKNLMELGVDPEKPKQEKKRAKG